MTAFAQPTPTLNPSPKDGGMAELAQAFWEQALRWQTEGAKHVSESFEIELGQTPRDLIWTLNKAALYRYRPSRPVSARHATPILLVYALINRPTIFDLRPGQSFVEFLRDAGFDVYLLDWGIPGPEDNDISLWEYTFEYLPRAVRKVLGASGAGKINMLGYCQGGLMALAYAAMFSEAPLRNLVVLTTPVDFSKTENDIFAVWLDKRYFDVDKLMDTLKCMPEGLILHGSKMLKPVENYLTTYKVLNDKMGSADAVQAWQALNRWTHEGQDLPGQVFRDWVKDLIWDNKLARGEVTWKGRAASLKNITVPVLNVLAEKDHIVPFANAASLKDLVGSADVRTEVIAGGHVGIMGGRAAKNRLWPAIVKWLEERSL